MANWSSTGLNYSLLFNINIKILKFLFIIFISKWRRVPGGQRLSLSKKAVFLNG